MFNGIIEKLAKVSTIKSIDSDNLQITVDVKTPFENQVKLGDSIALNGVCLTVEKILSQQSLLFTLGKETLDITSLKNLKQGDWLNLETAMRLNDQINGHLISGHVDAIATIEAIESKGESHPIVISYPKQLAPFVAKKGSITIDGVSLTVNELMDDFRGDFCQFKITIIHYTYQNTLFSRYKIGDQVNLEVDSLSRYIQRQLEISDTELK